MEKTIDRSIAAESNLFDLRNGAARDEEWIDTVRSWSEIRI